MEVCYGLIKVKKSKTLTQDEPIRKQMEKRTECLLCMKEIEDLQNDRLFCTNAKCKLIAHIQCLAKICLHQDSGHYIPTKGSCPICEITFLWGDLVRSKSIKQLEEDIDSEFDEEDYDI